jgi:hypothetical protein
MRWPCSTDQEAANCERRKAAKEAAYKIASAIGYASQVLADVRIAPETTQLQLNAWRGIPAKSSHSGVKVSGPAKRRLGGKSWHGHVDLHW